MLQMTAVEVPRRLETVRPDPFLSGLVERPAAPARDDRTTTYDVRQALEPTLA